MRRIALLTICTVLLILPASAQAAVCKKLAGKKPSLRSGSTYVYKKQRKRSDIGKTYYACTGKGKVRVLPSQDGGDTQRLGAFAVSGPWLAFAVVDVEEAASVYPAYIWVLNVKTGELAVNQAYAWPDESQSANVTFDVPRTVVAPDGAVAWVAHGQASPNLDTSNVQRIGPDGSRSTLASGTVDPKSLKATPDGATVSWTA